ncbi:hypothetical protein IG631_21352 [Alternaria alternata]|nr:hypothetical protein IG631_21352 [Alternaria alternata]
MYAITRCAPSTTKTTPERSLARIPNSLRDDVPPAAAHPRSASVLPTLRKYLQHGHVRIAPRHHHRDAQAG